MVSAVRISEAPTAISSVTTKRAAKFFSAANKRRREGLRARERGMICAALSVFAAPASSATGASTSDATPLGHASRELRSYVPQRPPPSEKEQKAKLDQALAKFGDGYRIVEKTAGDRVGSKAYWAAGGNHRLPSPPPPPPRGTQNLLMGAPSPPPNRRRRRRGTRSAARAAFYATAPTASPSRPGSRSARRSSRTARAPSAARSPPRRATSPAG